MLKFKYFYGFKYYYKENLLTQTGKNKHIGHLIRVAVAAGALYFAFRGESIRSIAKIFSDLNILVFLAALALYFFGQFIFVFRWLTLLRVQGISIKYLVAIRLHFLGLFYNNCLPGAVGGDVLRAWYVTKHTEKKIEAALSVFVDRVIGFFCTIAMAFLSYWLIPAQGTGAELKLGANFNIASLSVKLFAAGGVAIFLVAAVIAIMYYNRRLRPIFLKYAFILSLKWMFWAGRIIKAVKIYCTKPFALLFALLLSFICQAMPVYGLYLVGRNLGIEAHIKYYYVFFPLSWIIGVIPISVGGAGVMELGLKGLFGKVAEVSASQGLILALTQRLTWLLTSIPGVIIHITGKHLPDELENPKS
jgi:glycosyltransferase 2 family protein